MRSSSNTGRSDSRKKPTTKSFHKPETGDKKISWDKKSKPASESAGSERTARKSTTKTFNRPSEGENKPWSDKKPRFDKTSRPYSESNDNERPARKPYTRDVLKTDSAENRPWIEKKPRFDKAKPSSDSAGTGRATRKTNAKPATRTEEAENKPRFGKRPRPERTNKPFTESSNTERTGRKTSARPFQKTEEGETKPRFGKKPRFENNVKTNTESTEGKAISKPAVKKGYKLDENIRLNRFLSNSGVCSRREADMYISTGCVTVNGKMVSELGTKVSLNDDVRFNGQQLNPQHKVYLLLNKPKGFVTTTDDPQERKTVMDLVNSACTERIYPVGRLDKETTGVLLFTNDGDVAKKLTHPSYARKKIYHVFLDKPLTKNDLLEIAKGIVLDDGLIAADAINYVTEDNKREIGIEIHSGKNRIVRRIFAHLGYEVEKLDRVVFAGLTKKNLPRGKWRFLNQAEINQLKMQ